jgi:hypothetical protein
MFTENRMQNEFGAHQQTRSVISMQGNIRLKVVTIIYISL